MLGNTASSSRPWIPARGWRLASRRSSLSAVLVAGLLAWSPSAPSAAAAADVLVGCSGANNTATTADLQAFRQAILDSNTNANADTVRLAVNCTYSFTDIYSAFQSSWYGQAALPAIASDITIEGQGSIIQRDPSVGTPFRFFYVGADPANTSTLNYATPGAGKLTLHDVTLANGFSRGSNASLASGGGAGMGGAIFNQGQLILERVTIRDSIAQGGDGNGLALNGASAGNAGGIGGTTTAGSAAGFGTGFGNTGSSGGAGGPSTGAQAGSGGGGGGFRTVETGANGVSPGAGGAGGSSTARTGSGGSGGAVPAGAIGGASGDGSGGGGAAAAGTFVAGGAGGAGGRFGFGGAVGAAGSFGGDPYSPGGGGGAGGIGGGGGGGGNGASAAGSAGFTGGAGGGGGGGGFGGGGGAGGFGGDGGNHGFTGNGGDGGVGAQGGAGGFGGGGGGGGRGGSGGVGDSPAQNGTGGAGGSGAPGGFGGGNGTAGVFNFTGAGGGGAGMGGAIFNDHGQVTLRNTTLSGDSAVGGAGGGASSGISGAADPGQGLGGGIFNLNGTVAIDSATIAFDTADNGGGIYDLGYSGVDSTQCTALSCVYIARTTLVNSIVSNSTNGSAQAVTAVVSNRPTTVSTGAANLVPAIADFGTSPNHNIVTSSAAAGTGTLTGTPLTADPQLDRTLKGNPIAAAPSFIAPATQAITTSSPAFDTGATGLATDERGSARPQFAGDDIGAYEFSRFTPTMVIDAEPTVAGLGDQVRAGATLSGGSQTTGTVSFSLYGTTDTTCTGTPLSTSSNRLAGGTTLSGSSPALTTIGTYRWKASYSGDGSNFPVVGNCGDATVVVGKATTQLNVGALRTIITQGDPTQDAATVNSKVNLTGTITFKLYPPTDAGCTGTPVLTSTKTIGSPSFAAQSDPFMTNASGNYRWAAAYSGDATNNAAVGACGAPGQTVSVSFRPTLTTTAVPNHSGLGEPVHATATLVGGANPTGTVTFNLYRPSDTTCTSPPVFTSTVPISLSGAATSASYTPVVNTGQFVETGTYTWIAVYSGDASNPASAPQTCGASGQTVLVGKTNPTLSAQVTQSQVVYRSGATDVATIGNLMFPNGLMTFQLFNASDTTCSTPNFTSTVSVFAAPTNSSGQRVVTSQPTIPGEGTYHWRASYAADTYNNGVTEPCGDPNQTVVVAKLTPTLTITQLTPATAVVGQPVHATATVSGGASTGQVSFTAYGPGTPGQACDPNNTNIVLFSYTIDDNGGPDDNGHHIGNVTGDGVYRSGDFTPSVPGTYWWRVHFNPTNTIDNPGDENCGAHGTLVVKDATTTTITSDAPDPSLVGQLVTVHYAVAAKNVATPAPTGNVTVSDGVTSCVAPVAAGTCNLTLTTPGLHSLIATYGGDGLFTTSTSTAEPHGVAHAPAITSANNTTFEVGAAGSFSVATTGYPNATITASGVLPAGVTLVDNHDGTAGLSGTPAVGAAGVYPMTITAANGYLPNATQMFSLTVDHPPVITSADHTTFASGTSGSFLVTTAAGLPPATTFTQTGALPAGVGFTDNHDGTATLTGTSIASGTYLIAITARNDAFPGTTQHFVLTISKSPSITSTDHAAFTVGAASTFTVTTTAGVPASTTLVHVGVLPTGVSFIDNGDGTVTLAGVPGAATGGTYPITFTASNGATPDPMQTFTLTVSPAVILQQSPAITSGVQTTFTIGGTGSFTVTTTGSPTVTTITATGTLPAGVSFTDNGDGTATLSGTSTMSGAFPISITASNGVIPAATQAVVLSVATGPDNETIDYVPVVPDRVLETRPDGQVGYSGGRPAAGQVVELDVTGVGTSHVPDDAGAVVLNVTGTNASAVGYVTVWPCGSPQPTASNLNLAPGVSSPNLVVSKIGVNGRVCLFTQVAADLIADINGYMPIHARYVPLIPERILETRPDRQTGYSGGKPTAGSTIELQVTGVGASNIPADAGAVVMNVTGTGADLAGYVSVWPCGSAQPKASNLNLAAGGTSPNLVVSKIGSNGKVCLYTQSSVDLIADVNGYMPAGSSYQPAVPERLLETRTDGQTGYTGAKPVAGSTIELQVTGVGATNVPATANAVVLNVTGVGADAPGYVTVWPCGSPQPNASNLNLTAGGISPNLVMAKIGTGGKVCIFTQSSADIVADINGYWP